jgi:Secretion system C-terminal sorting domain
MYTHAIVGHSKQDTGIAALIDSVSFDPISPYTYGCQAIPYAQAYIWSGLLWDTTTSTQTIRLFACKAIDKALTDTLDIQDGSDQMNGGMSVKDSILSVYGIQKNGSPSWRATVWNYRLKNFGSTAPLSIPYINTRPVISVFPNPAADLLHIDGIFGTTTIIDMSGKIMVQYHSTQTQHIYDIHSYPRGMYLITIQQGNVQYTTHFIKQ